VKAPGLSLEKWHLSGAERLVAYAWQVAWMTKAAISLQFPGSICQWALSTAIFAVCGTRSPQCHRTDRVTGLRSRFCCWQRQLQPSSYRAGRAIILNALPAKDSLFKVIASHIDQIARRKPAFLNRASAHRRFYKLGLTTLFNETATNSLRFLFCEEE
jgi:hypothetical protein